MRNLLFLIINLILITQLTSCYDAHEISEWGYVYSIGFEKGVTDKLRITVQVASMQATTGEGGGSSAGGNSIENIIIDCPTFYSGINMINAFFSRKLNYMHAKYLVFSDTIAREGIESFVTGFARGIQMRRQINVIVCRGSASDFLEKNEITVSASLSKKQENLIKRGQEDTGYFPNATYGEMLGDFKNYSSSAIAILACINDEKNIVKNGTTKEMPFKTSGDYFAGELVRKGASGVELLGTAIFNGGKMVGELNGDQTRVLLMVRNEFESGEYVVQDPLKKNLTVTTNIKKQKNPSIKVKIIEGRPYIDVKIYLEGDIRAIQSTIDYEEREQKALLENEFKKQIKNELDRTIKKCQSLDSDVFKFGYYAATNFLTIPKWEEYHWLGKFKEAKVNTEVNFVIRRTGSALRSSEIVSSEGEKGE